MINLSKVISISRDKKKFKELTDMIVNEINYYIKDRSSKLSCQNIREELELMYLIIVYIDKDELYEWFNRCRKELGINSILRRESYGRYKKSGIKLGILRRWGDGNDVYECYVWKNDESESVRYATMPYVCSHLDFVLKCEYSMGLR